MLDRLRQGGLPHVDATEPYEPVIDYSDDDDYALLMILIEIISSVR